MAPRTAISVLVLLAAALPMTDSAEMLRSRKDDLTRIEDYDTVSFRRVREFATTPTFIGRHHDGREASYKSEVSAKHNEALFIGWTSMGLVINAPVQPALAPVATMSLRQVQLPSAAPASVSAIFPTSSVLSSLIDDEADAFKAKNEALRAKKEALKAKELAAEKKAEEDQAKAAAKEAARTAEREAAAAARKVKAEAEAKAKAEAKAAALASAPDEASKKAASAKYGSEVVKVDARAERIAARKAAGDDAPSLFGK